MVLPKARLMYSSSSLINTCKTSKTASPVHLMSLPAILVGILVLVVVTPLQAHPLIPSGNSHSFEYKHYCSNSLSDVIRLLCGGPYSSQQYTHYTDNSDAFSSNSLKRLASDDGIYFRNVQTERIHECCQRPCGYSELKMYCAPKMFSLKYIISTQHHRILSFTTIILVICLIVIIYMPTPAQTHPLSPQDGHTPNRRYCSTALFEAIRVICEGRTNSLSSRYPDSVGNRRPSLLRRLLPDDDVIFRPSFGGAVHECCRRPCGYSELHAYCED
ncbi:hypothetical protein FF38_02304 [Lucilia cuprina]|uniref:Insulin-like domain-containing protein n=2 Tax=Lucilia cuprina TaxID=7375 RepID=A0A0L0C3Z6_LUCCU|nr:hypothetical protein FF38_02304 [Lucilia cuprina]